MKTLIQKKLFVIATCCFYFIVLFLSMVSCTSNDSANSEGKLRELDSIVDESFNSNYLYGIQQTKDELLLKYPNSKEYKKADSLYAILEKKLAAERKKAMDSAYSKVYVERDEIEKVYISMPKTFYHTKNNEEVSLLMISSDSKSKSDLILKISYLGSRWIFFDKVILFYDGQRYDISCPSSKKNKEVLLNGLVSESINLAPVDGDLLQFLRNSTTSKEVLIRLSGRFLETRPLSEKERKGIEDMLYLYDVYNYIK